jgi:hypothetical protein
MCYSYTRADFKSNEQYDSGVRIEQQTNSRSGIEITAPASPARPASASGLFTIQANTEVLGATYSSGFTSSRADCEEICAREPSCKALTYNKNNKQCYRFSGTFSLTLQPNTEYESGVRIGQTNLSSPSSPPASSIGLFTIRADTEASASGSSYPAAFPASSRADCEEICAREPSCKAFTYNKNLRHCYRFSGAFSLTSNTAYDSGVRNDQTNPNFEIRLNTEATGSAYFTGVDGTRSECEEGCAREWKCRAFTYNKSAGRCYRYTETDLRSNERYDSGVRIERTNPNSDIKITAPASPAKPESSSRLFAIQANTEASASGRSYPAAFPASSRTDCEESCAREPSCNAFTYNKNHEQCYRFSGAFSLAPNTAYDTGVRK